MNYSVKIAESGDYVIVNATGPVYRETARAFTEDAYTLSKQTGILKHLIDLRGFPNMETLVENFKYADTDLGALPMLDRRVRVALLVDEDDHSHDVIETLVVNRGHTVRIFRNLEKALEYLKVKG
jgi:hypothetical protein